MTDDNDNDSAPRPPKRRRYRVDEDEIAPPSEDTHERLCAGGCWRARRIGSGPNGDGRQEE